MAVKKKVVEIDTQKALTSIKDLRQQLKLLKDQMIKAEEGTDEYNEALQQAADIMHTLKEQQEELAASAMDFGQIMGNVTSTIGGVISGFQALTASMSLLGVENKDALETIKKLQSLMALTQGISGVEKGIKSFRRLVNVISNSTLVTKLFNTATKGTATAEATATVQTKGLQSAMVGEATATNTATTATNAFKKALISTGLGAIVVAIGILVANMDKLVKVFSASAKEAERQADAMRKLKQNIEDVNMSVSYYEKEIKKLSDAHRKELKDMDDVIAKMKAEGKAEAVIAAQQEKFNKRRKEIYQEEIKDINKAQKAIEKYFKKEKNIQLDRQNAYDTIHRYQKQIIDNERIIEKLEEGKKVSGYTKDSVEILKQRNDRLKLNIEQLEKWLDLENSELDILDDINDMDNKVSNDRIANRRKLNEELKKWDDQLLVESKQDKDKELAQVDVNEQDKLKMLKKYYDEGLISKQTYERKQTEITELYNKKRNEIVAKYVKQDNDKAAENLNHLFNIERRQLAAARDVQALYYENEHTKLLEALSFREITISEYYRKELDLINDNLAKQKQFVEKEYKSEQDLLVKLYNERGQLLELPGLKEEEKQKIEREMDDLIAQLQQSVAEYNLTVQQLENDTVNHMRELNMRAIDEEMNFLRAYSDELANSMDSIIGTADGLSSQWTRAFETMSNSVINLSQKVREGGALWNDYAQLAISAFQSAGAVMSALADEQDAQTQEGFEQQKKYQIAATTMNMMGGIVSAWTSALNPTNSWMTIWGQIAMGAAMSAMMLTTGLMQIQKIQQQQFNGSDASGASSGLSNNLMGTIVAPLQYTQDVKGASIEDAIKDTRVYVTEGDISSTVKKVSVTESEARF